MITKYKKEHPNSGKWAGNFFIRVLLLTIFFLPDTGSAVPAQSRKTNDKLKEEIRKLDLAHADAILRRDAGALNKLLAEDVTTNHPTNKIVSEREGIFELIRKGVINYSSFVRVPEAFLFYKKMVVVMGNETLVMADSGKTVRRRYSNFWMKKKGKWVLSVRHAHIVCENLTEANRSFLSGY